MRLVPLLLAAAGLVAAGCVSPAVEPASDGIIPPGLLPTLVRSVQVDARWSGEPSILALSDGTLLITGASGMTRYAEDPADALGNAGQSYLWRSTDAGETWTFLDLGLPGPAAALLPYRNAVMGVEGDLAQDEAGRAYFVDLAALAANGLSASDDNGATWTAVQNPFIGQPGTDRPWVAALGDGHVYVKYLQTSSGHRVARSTDGGLTFLEDVALPTCGQADMTVDLGSREILIACVQGDKLSLLRTPAEAPMNWERVEMFTADGPASNVFTSLAVAQSGAYVYAWSERVDDGARVRVSTSLDRGVTWSEPVTLSGDEKTAVFPWVDANADGTVAVVWYEADQWGTSDAIDAAWFPLHASLRLDAMTGLSAPAISVLSEDKVHQGAICTSGLGCVLSGRGEDRRLLDFFEVDVDAQGVSHVTWTSTQTAVPSIWYGQVTRAK